MTSTLTGPRAAAVLRERYVWSVFPALSAWPVLLGDVGPGSLIVAVLLVICYLSDRSYARLGSLPAWYMTLRGWLTTLSMMSMLATTAYYFAQDVKRAQAQAALAEQRRAEAAALAAAQAAAPATAPEQQEKPGAKKGGRWFGRG